jgi:hypothetical protein
MLERILKACVSLLTFDCDAEQPSESGKKIGVVLIELAWIGAVDFEHAEEGFPLPARFEHLMHYEFSAHGMRPERDPETCNLCVCRA